ncbi:hypothetical protein [Streptococcus pneumoniae]|uniref:hypothetical protein n=1 Tax=Streptococcus pneumoniae TaxID=1313 RepID=UPI000768B3DB|nr:hypothetical protein [Streptococcus pneumoniae]VLO96237.1 Uncharacterised protein [Streptococcus pneumoniae]HEU8110760.1 hypothetical protein [Streptococcus pneumoniae]HEW8834911.1 hypothetical protein [Streptococcus pneumoniae]HEX1173293.1 hypothetical protein [Streptococcus pneumoniae]
MLNQDLFDSLEAQKIVDTLMKGQKDYVDERLEKRETMIVSNGYAWTRPNHIDTAFASADLSEYIQSSSYHFEEAKYQDIPNFSELSETEDFEIIPRIEKQEGQK